MKIPLFLMVALSAASMLTACGGGGGGGGIAAASGGTQTYARLIDPNLNLDLTTVSTNFTSHGAGTVALTPQGGTVAAHLTTDALVQPTIRIDVASVDGLSFSETFAPADLTGIAPFPDASASLSVVAGSKTAVDGSIRSISFVAPAAGLLEYSTLGAWGYDLGSLSYGGFVSAGVTTRGTDIPVTGGAAYTGLSIALYSDGVTPFAVGAVASATADFGSRSLSFATTNSQKVSLLAPNALPVADGGLNINGTLIYPAGTNSITGAITTQNGMSGAAQARFYGPAAVELGGVYRLSGIGTQMEGGFLMRR